MATEKQTFLDSFLPQNCMSRAEAFAKCLHDKLKSLSGNDDVTKVEKEDKRSSVRYPLSSVIACEPAIGNITEFADNIFVQNPSIYYPPQNIENHPKKTRKHKRIKKNLSSDNGSSESEEEVTGRVEVGGLQEITERVNNFVNEGTETTELCGIDNHRRLTKNNSDDSAVDSNASWCSCEETIVLGEEVVEADEEDENEQLVIQVRGSPGIKKFRRHKGRKTDKGKTKKEAIKSPQEQEIFFDFDTECFSPQNEPEESPSENDIINNIQDYEVPHRILRGSSSAGDLEVLAHVRQENCRNFNEFEETTERAVHTLSSECLRLSASPECQSILTPPPSPASKRNSQDNTFANNQSIINFVLSDEIKDCIEGEDSLVDVEFNDEDQQELVEQQNELHLQNNIDENLSNTDDEISNCFCEEENVNSVDTKDNSRTNTDLLVVELEDNQTHNEELEKNDSECVTYSEIHTPETGYESDLIPEEKFEESQEIISKEILKVSEVEEIALEEHSVENNLIKPNITITNFDEDDYFEEMTPQIKLRRCSSLKSWKTPPGTPGRKKIVRFADALGLDLADVRTFLDEIPKIPNSAYDDLKYEIPCFDIKAKEDDKTLVPQFQQPVGRADFMTRVQIYNVCLENATVSDPKLLIVSGLVRVKNLDYHKVVHIRYTLDNWTSFSDLQATYVPNSCDGFSDKFSFDLYGHPLRVGQTLEFAIKYQCKGYEFWDNNLGFNYTFQCLSPSDVKPDSTIVPTNPTDEVTEVQWPVFY